MLALYSNNFAEVAKTTESAVNNPHIFNTTIPLEGTPVTNQKRSGRCWLFGALNVFRVPIMKKYNLGSFELSQKYLYYYHKLEKANWILEQIIDTAHEEDDSRIVHRLLRRESLASDGGQWDMVYNLVSKYGLVPQAVYPDSLNAENSRDSLGVILPTVLQQYAQTLRATLRSDTAAAKSDIRLQKAEMMAEIQRIITLLLGPPPNPMEAFTWQYVDKDKSAHEIKMTPREFSDSMSTMSPPISVQNMISLANDPRHEPMSLLTISRLGNVVGGRQMTYVNVEMHTLKDACVKMIQTGRPVFFACDFGKFRDKQAGILDIGRFDYEAVIGHNLLSMSKKERLLIGESTMTHVMVLTGVHISEDTHKPVRWKVENSHGKESANQGYYTMTDAWMDEFVFQATVDKEVLEDCVVEVLNQSPTVLPLWDHLS